MYARELMKWLHERLAGRYPFEETEKRFERLRGNNLLPRGRANAGIRLSDEQIANAILGFAHPSPGFAGHAALILGDLRPVGGKPASFRETSNLKCTIVELIRSKGALSKLLRITFSVMEDFGSQDYGAIIYYEDGFEEKRVSYVSKLSHSSLRHGAEHDYPHERLDKMSAIERSLGPVFFRDLSRSVAISRQLNRPLKTDWREYNTEEEKEDLNRRLGARRGSDFVNFRVDSQVAWPKEPTRMEFGGYNLVLFPKTKEHSHSISIDLKHERLNALDARTLTSRLLSVMSWCENQSASLHDGWSGAPVPLPVPKRNLASSTMDQWYFHRALPRDEKLLRCLAYYRDGLNADSVGLASHAVLSFYRVFETRYHTKKKAVGWVNDTFPLIKSSVPESALQTFELEHNSEMKDIGNYIYESFRVATAHAARDWPSDPDVAEETRRLLSGAKIMSCLARSFIEQEFSFSDSYLSDDFDSDE